EWFGYDADGRMTDVLDIRHAAIGIVTKPLVRDLGAAASVGISLLQSRLSVGNSNSGWRIRIVVIPQMATRGRAIPGIRQPMEAVVSVAGGITSGVEFL